MRTLITTSARAKAVPGKIAHLLLSQAEGPEQVTSNFQSAAIKQQRYPVAVILEGKFKSAYREDPTIRNSTTELPPVGVNPAPIILP
tara:strand:- start:326 stop:586 length:261 start_codon:yes stop_codon:yes gene_type:complete